MVLLLAAACRASGPEPAPATAPLQPDPDLLGICDASAAVAIGDWLLVADDERNLLHVYGADGREVEPIVLDLGAKKESDLEGMALVGDVLWVIGSHDRGKGTEPKPDRQRLVGLRVTATERGVSATVAHGPVRGLLDHPPMDAIVASTAGRTCKEPGGLSIEGLASGPGGSLVVGFRAPVRDGKALVARLQDPTASPPSFSPQWIDLGGRGIRSLEADGEGWLGVAGPPGEGDGFDLFRWAGGEAAPTLLGRDLGDLNPEALVRWQGAWWVLSDDGGRDFGGRDCKDLPVSERRARTARVEPG